MSTTVGKIVASSPTVCGTSFRGGSEVNIVVGYRVRHGDPDGRCNGKVIGGRMEVEICDRERVKQYGVRERSTTLVLLT